MPTVMSRHGPGNCSKCPTRDGCKTLCSEAEAVADRDHVPQRELTIGLPMATGTETDEEDDRPRYTDMQRSIVRLLLSGHTSEDVCKLLEITKESYYMHVCRMKKRRRELLDSLLR